MKTKKVILAIAGIAVLVMLIGGVIVLYSKNQGESEQEVEIEDASLFVAYTDCEYFKDVPAMLVENTQIDEAEDCGGDTWQICVDGTELSDYWDYLSTLEEAGFERHVDNGETGLDNSVYNAMFQKDGLVVTVIHLEKMDKTYITANQGMPVSEHLLYSDSYKENEQQDAKTKLHMLELYMSGNSYIVQLKNGHFIVNDGGYEQDLPYLIEYLEDLAPEDEKPVIEAWIISHAHEDHMGAFRSLYGSEYVKRIYVEGVYFNEPSAYVCAQLPATASVFDVLLTPTGLKTSENETTSLYRMQSGQRYFFDDITIDVLFTQEQLLLENYSGDFNETSTWLMYTIEGQKVLICGDADTGSMDAVMRIYDTEYFDLDVYSVFHHGINVFDKFTDFVTYKTALYTNYRIGSYHVNDEYERAEANKHLQEKAEECMAWGDGTKILTFPYEVGTAEKLPLREWKYNAEPRENLLKTNKQ